MTTRIRVYAEVFMGSSPLFGYWPHLPPFCLGAKGILARKSKNLMPSGIFPQLPGFPGCKIASLVALARQRGPPLRQAHFAGSPRGRCVSCLPSRALFSARHSLEATRSSNLAMQRGLIFELREGALDSLR